MFIQQLLSKIFVCVCLLSEVDFPCYYIAAYQLQVFSDFKQIFGLSLLPKLFFFNLNDHLLRRKRRGFSSSLRSGLRYSFTRTNFCFASFEIDTYLCSAKSLDLLSVIFLAFLVSKQRKKCNFAAAAKSQQQTPLFCPQNLTEFSCDKICIAVA